MRIEKLKGEHIAQMKALGVVRYLSEADTSPERLKAMENEKYAYAAFDDDGRILACGGVVEWWANRGDAWMMFNNDCRVDFLKIHNAVKRFLDVCPLRRIEATVDYNFVAGHRWIKLLGFTLEAPRLRAYTMDGRDVALYSLVRGI